MAKKHQETTLEWFYRVVIPKATSLGAAVVVLGALFKIMHYKGAGEMLTIGLCTESFIFLLGVFQPAPPVEAHYDWSLVYPELSSGQAKAKDTKAIQQDPKVSEKLALIDKMILDANLTPDAFKNFGAGMGVLNESVKQMKDVSNATLATNEYANTLKTATSSINELNKAYGNTINTMNQLATATNSAKEYHSQIQNLTKNLGALNAVYEMELNDANSHIKAMNKFYSNLTVAMESMSDASKESEVFKNQMKSLTGNLTTLNKVYGNMIAAMKA